jgi:hypothetical protein
VVLDDVAHRTHRVVEVPAVGDAEVLAHRDLDTRHVLTVPHRFQNAVREAQIEDVLDRHLPEEVVDPVELRLVDQRVEARVELAGGLEVMAERLLDDDASLRSVCVGKATDDCGKQGRWNLEIEHGEFGTLDLLCHTLIGRGVGEVTVDVRELVGEALESRLVERLTRRDNRVASVLDEVLERPVVERDADDSAEEGSTLLQSIERAEGHDPREVAGDPEDDEDVGRLRAVAACAIVGHGVSSARRVLRVDPVADSPTGAAFQTPGVRAPPHLHQVS